MSHTKQLKQLLDSKQLLIAPGVFDGMSARLAEQAGFSLLYASGGAISRGAGFPDIGLLTMTEMCDAISKIVDATSLPVIADGDTGYGNEVNVKRVMKIYERMGVAGIHLEDQEFPKRCGHLSGKKLIPTEEMVIKVKMARDTLSDPNFLLIARTDAIAVEGFDAALERARAYLDAGANMIFVEAPETEAQVEQIAKAIPQPKLINMFYGGNTPLIPKETLQAWGYQIVIIPSDLQRAAIHAMQKTLRAILQYGDSSSMAAELASFKEREAIIGTKDWLS
jgi:2-methylisocitrate lyase-like PEP mutase family enzyme